MLSRTFKYLPQLNYEILYEEGCLGGNTRLWFICIQLRRGTHLPLRNTSIFSIRLNIMQVLSLWYWTVPEFNEIKAQRTSQQIVSLSCSIHYTTKAVTDTVQLVAASVPLIHFPGVHWWVLCGNRETYFVIHGHGQIISGENENVVPTSKICSLHLMII